MQTNQNERNYTRFRTHTMMQLICIYSANDMTTSQTRHMTRQ